MQPGITSAEPWDLANLIGGAFFVVVVVVVVVYAMVRATRR
jgi:hypothetical protein